jgi:hypothetical protein
MLLPIYKADSGRIADDAMPEIEPMAALQPAEGDAVQ